MRLPVLPLSFALLLFPFHASSSSSSNPQTQTYTIAYEPLAASGSGAAAATPFATIISNPSSPPPLKDGAAAAPKKQSASSPSYSLASFTRPKTKENENEKYVRIGLLAPSGMMGSHKFQEGSTTTLARLSALTSPAAPAVLRVVLDSEGAVRSASIHLDTNTNTNTPSGQEVGEQQKGKEKGKEGGLRVEVVAPAEAPRPLLNKPVVLNAEGKLEEPPQEKTLLQKYWWVGLAIVAFTLVGGGGDK